MSSGSCRTVRRVTESLAGDAPVVRRHSVRKSHGVHYTPSQLAGFVARRALAELPERERYVVLDPACGDGELLLAVAAAAEEAGLPAPSLVGVDRDVKAVAAANERLGSAYAASAVARCEDFLATGKMLSDEAPSTYDLVISNPPYVRTQVLGAVRAQALGRQFGLTGRIDLYHAFVAAMTVNLGEGGVLGLLCSNRFLTTKGGNSLRALLLRHYEVAEVWDLGDTKLFEAAVLPAVVVARRASSPVANPGRFVRVYEDTESSDAATNDSSLLSALEADTQGTVQVLDRRFTIERGALLESSAERPWRLTSSGGSRWLGVVKQHSAGRLGDIGPIRVGIKTTADNVFIRPSWDDLPEEMRPEEALLHPLLTHRVAARWQAERKAAGERSVLYPHEMKNGRRRPVDLSVFPRAASYLEMHRERLEGREYVRKAGRAWYEVWVPQQPDAWAAPKLVWPDISDRPRFFLDCSGSIVNGDCYWLSCAGQTDAEVSLALAVANSSFALRYYDLCCGNRLYAGRRRFITQYLEELPMPEASSAAMRDIVEMVNQIRLQDLAPEVMATVESALDAAVFELFGLKEVVR
jgi:adenine-specific DNA-methyltransferase